MWHVIQSTAPVQGHILSLLAVNGMLFSGSNDSCIHVWKYDPATGSFNPAVCLFSGHPAVLTCGALAYCCSSAVRLLSCRVFTRQYAGWQVALTSATGGHGHPVQAMVVVNQFMFSADWGGSIKVLADSTILDV